jgi:response regulator NasT
MDECQMSEQDAFRYLQKTAMSKRTSMKHISQEVIDGNLRPD